MAELSALDALLGAKPVAELTTEVKIERLGANFKVKALTGEDVARLREECTRYEIQGKNRKSFVDNEALTLAMIVEATISPDFSDAKLLKHYGVDTANECVNKALTFGEVNKLTDAILTISGLNEDDDIEEIKNS